MHSNRSFVPSFLLSMIEEDKSDSNRIPTQIAMTTAADNRDEVAFKKAVDSLPYEVKRHTTYT